MTTVINMDNRLTNILSALQELGEDNTIPKNVKLKVEKMIITLKDESVEFVLRKDTALNVLDEISEDTNIQAYTRTQMWNLVSALEML